MKFGRRVRMATSGTLSLALCVLSASCLNDPDPEPMRRALEFRTLVSPSVVSPGTSSSAQVAFEVGPSGCWGIEWLRVTLRGTEIHIEGGGIDPRHRDTACADASVRGLREVELPALPSGDYEIVAGGLRTPLVVTQEFTSATEEASFLGSLEFSGPEDLHASGCGWGTFVDNWWFTGLPAEVVPGDYSIHGRTTGDDPCSLADWFSPLFFSRFIAVSRIEPIDSRPNPPPDEPLQRAGSE